jgi:hypothetical protein
MLGMLMMLEMLHNLGIGLVVDLLLTMTALLVAIPPLP